MEELAVIFMTIQINFLQAECVASLFNMRNKAVQMGWAGMMNGHVVREYMAGEYMARGYMPGEYTTYELLPI